MADVLKYPLLTLALCKAMQSKAMQTAIQQ